MKNSRLIATVTAGALAVAALAGCSASGGTDNKTLTVAATTTSKPAMEKVITAFKEANPGVTVKATYADTDALQTTLRTQLTSGTAPDVFTVWPGYGTLSTATLQKSGYLADLSDHAFVSEVPEGVKLLSQIDGKQWVAPIAVVGIGAIYNDATLKATGLTAPTTLDELYTFCSDAKSKGKVAFALANQTAWVTQLVNYALVPTTVFRTNPDFDKQMAAGDAKFVDSGWVDAFDQLMEMNKRGCFTKDSLGTSFESSVDAVAKGQALGVVQVTSTLASIQAAAPKDTSFQILPLPATNTASDSWMAAALGDSYGINAKAKNTALASKFIDFLTSSEQLATYAEAAGAIPALPSADFKADPALETLISYQKDGKTYPFMDQFWPNSDVQQAHLDGVQKVFAGTSTIHDVLASMDAAYAEGVK